MDQETNPVSDEERATQALIAAACQVLDGEQRGVPEDFVAGLFERAVPEDLMRYDPREVAALAADAWALLAHRKPSTPNIRLALPTEAHERLKANSVLEVINDDMPFLVDSVLGELAERGLDVRLVVHPVFAVARASDGGLVEFKGAHSADAGGLRESFIHIHVERIDDAARRAEIVDAIARALADVRAAVTDWRDRKSVV